MRHQILAWLLAAVTLSVGCGPSDEIADRSPDTLDRDGPNDGLGDPEKENAEFNLIATWDEVSLTFDVYGSQGVEFYCGLAETGSSKDPWVEESCVGSLYCHPCGTTGVELALGGDRADLQEGKETGFPDKSYQSGVTYYAERTSDNACWVWGDNVNYYLIELLEDCERWTPKPVEE